MIQQKGRFSCSAYMVYVSAKMEDPQWVSKVLSNEKRCERPGGYKGGKGIAAFRWREIFSEWCKS